MKKYNFTKDWFLEEELEKNLPIGTDDELHILEVGSFEGKSTIWFIQNLLGNQNSTITCVDSWMNFVQNENSFSTYNENTKTASGVDFVKDGIKDTFLNNIKNTGESDKVTLYHSYSHIILPKLITENKKYDIIYIDGNHTSPAVLTDAIMSFYLLNCDGILIFDDYLWGNINSLNSPKIAIDSFYNIFQNYVIKIWHGNKIAFKKIINEI
jgi:predicted O-methyltransferase YrrM